MAGGNKDHGRTAHKVGEPDIQEFEEPQALNVVIDGSFDFPDKRRRTRFFLLIFALVAAVSVTLGVSLGLTSRNDATQSQRSSVAVSEFMNGLPLYSLELAQNDSESPQAKALAWLQAGPLYNQYELYRLHQRYALAVLYYSTDGGSWNRTTRWLSNDNECTWYQYDGDGPEDDNSCMNASRLTFLDLYGNDLGRIDSHGSGVAHRFKFPLPTKQRSVGEQHSVGENPFRIVSLMRAVCVCAPVYNESSRLLLASLVRQR
jgi:hypothetical protein